MCFIPGIVVILGGSLGYIFGGVIVSKAELTVRGMIKFCSINTAVAMAAAFICLYVCPNIGEYNTTKLKWQCLGYLSVSLGG